MIDDEELLVALLNSAPVVDGRLVDQLVDVADAGLVSRGEFAARFGGTGTAEERELLRRMREALQALIRGDRQAAVHIEELLADVRLTPEVTAHGIRWRLDAPANVRLAARAAHAWSRVQEQLPGRLRACANSECNLYLIDRSRPGTAKWCSMATCGNRMKARAHAARRRA